MKTIGIDKGLIQTRDTSKRGQLGWEKGFFDFRKMFRDFHETLNVAYYDPCCPAATPEDIFPMRFNAGTGQPEYFDGSTWVEATGGVVNGLRSFNEPEVQSYSTPSAVNATATATAAQVKTGLITSTSAAATSITLPTATLLGTALGASRGSQFEFVVDNSQGANTVTVVLGTGIVTATPIITGGATLTVPSGAAGVGIFRLVFKSATTAVLFRIG